MTTRVDVENRIQSIPTAGTQPAIGNGPAARPAGPSFGQVLQDHLTQQAVRANIKFSSHAQTRLASRGIALSSDDITRLGNAITKAAAKGARESLVLMDQAALVVSVPNRTVITAVDTASLKENIFTNIDSALIL